MLIIDADGVKSVNGRTIRIYLAEGEPNGIMTAEIINWTGKMIVAPRSKLSDLARRKEAKRAGVYVLTGDDPDTLSRKRVYVGESDDVFSRLVQHQGDETKDFWTDTALILSKDENLTKSHVRYLESRLIKVLKNARRASIANSNTPEFKALPESDIADMEFFLTQIQVLLPVLGFSFTQPPPTQQSSGATLAADSAEATDQELTPRFYMNPVGTNATAQELNGEFVVLKGSTARKESKAGVVYKPLRDQLIQDEKLVGADHDDFFVFTEDVSFSSPSAAASVVYGGNQNGRKVWKIEGRGETYGKWQEEKLKRVEYEADSESSQSEV